jgi:hypothetical protein
VPTLADGCKTGVDAHAVLVTSLKDEIPGVAQLQCLTPRLRVRL